MPIFLKRIETFSAEDHLRVGDEKLPVLSAKVGGFWVTLTIQRGRKLEKIRAPRGTLLEAPLPATEPTGAVVETAAQAAYLALSASPTRFAPDKGVRWSDLAPRDREGFERLAYDMLIGKYRPAEDQEERTALNLVEDVVLATARAMGWTGR